MPQTNDNNPHIFGIRHHGPGSARSVKAALERLGPDIILVEGPPEAEAVLPLLAHEQMKPPVALLLYMPDKPEQAVYYPFAVFSPEWQALHYGLTHDIPVRFMDLPQSYQLGQDEPEAPAEAAAPPTRQDPLGALAEAAGYSDGERWWEHLVEQRRDSEDLFAGILEAMAAVRADAPDPQDVREERREAWMRQTIRAAQKEGKERIAVVCGAWHGPALASMPSAKADAETLAGLPKAKVAATWVPWTYGRLSYSGGYGAGIESPGWYHHLWQHPNDVSVHWMSRVAHLLREQDLDASPASVIEGVRLADTLAALRGRPLPGLPEMNEATQSVFCFGSDVPMRLIWRDLIVGDTLGAVPDETPAVPLQQDLGREQKRLRLAPEVAQRDLDLDLRKPADLDKSGLLHRLALLGIPWGDAQRQGGGKGTFHELWRLQWQPEFIVKVIEAGFWGNTVRDASASSARDQADKAPDLPALTALLDRVLLADLPDAVRHVMARLEAEAALASDVSHLMGALPPLAQVLRYGNVRQTDTTTVGHIVDGPGHAHLHRPSRRLRLLKRRGRRRHGRPPCRRPRRHRPAAKRRPARPLARDPDQDGGPGRPSCPARPDRGPLRPSAARRGRPGRRRRGFKNGPGPLHRRRPSPGRRLGGGLLEGQRHPAAARQNAVVRAGRLGF